MKVKNLTRKEYLTLVKRRKKLHQLLKTKKTILKNRLHAYNALARTHDRLQFSSLQSIVQEDIYSQKKLALEYQVVSKALQQDKFIRNLRQHAHLVLGLPLLVGVAMGAIAMTLVSMFIYN